MSDGERTWLDHDRTVDMYPDLVLRAGGQIRLVADCKYKKSRPDDFVNQDVYQLNAYCAATSCRDGVLIYPRHELAVGETITVGEMGTRLRQISIDLGVGPSSLTVGCDRFAQTVGDMIGVADGRLRIRAVAS